MGKYANLDEYLAAIEPVTHADQLAAVLKQLQENHPGMELRIAWNQPMLTDHGTFIMGLSVARNHFSVAVEAPIFADLQPDISAAGYKTTTKLFQIPWDQPVNYALLDDAIAASRKLKADTTSFWL